jgi:hypothetical protein
VRVRVLVLEYEGVGESVVLSQSSVDEAGGGLLLLVVLVSHGGSLSVSLLDGGCV